MDPITIGLLCIGGLLLLVLLGVPVAVAMFAIGIGGMLTFSGETMTFATLRTLPYALASNYSFAVVPMFILMGALASNAGIINELYSAAYRWMVGLRGSLYIATTLASAAFGAISGSTIVNAVVFTRMALPEMIQFGFNRGVGGGCIAAAGTLAAMIPPSITMVLYGILTGESIGQLLIAGLLPGLLTALVYVVGIMVFVQIFPSWAPPTSRRFTWGQKFESLRGLWPLVILVALVLGGIYTGAMPPSAAGAVGAMGALAILALRGRMTRDGLRDAVVRSAIITSVLFIIIIAGMLFSRLLLVTGFVGALVGLVSGSDLHPYVFLGGIILMYFVLGMFIDPISMMVMTVPFVYPLVTALGFDAIWFGIIMVKMVEIAAVTPPVGINLYAVLSASEGRLTSRELFVGVLPFVLLDLVILALLIAFPVITLILPRTMM